MDSIIGLDSTPVAVMEIGGYFAPIGNQLKSKYGRYFLGSIEDTENGHRRYEQVSPRNFPVISVARSRLKRFEDRLMRHLLRGVFGREGAADNGAGNRRRDTWRTRLWCYRGWWRGRSTRGAHVSYMTFFRIYVLLQSQTV